MLTYDDRTVRVLLSFTHLDLQCKHVLPAEKAEIYHGTQKQLISCVLIAALRAGRKKESREQACADPTFYLSTSYRYDSALWLAANVELLWCVDPSCSLLPNGNARQGTYTSLGARVKHQKPLKSSFPPTLGFRAISTQAGMRGIMSWFRTTYLVSICCTRSLCASACVARCFHLSPPRGAAVLMPSLSSSMKEVSLLSPA